jgi:hypothetical protein
MSYDPSAKYTRNDLMRLARVFGVHTTRGAPGDRSRNMRPRPTADLRAAIAKGRPVAGRSLATSFQSSDLMQYTMYNLRYFAKQMKVPMTYRGRTKTKAELLKGLTLAAKGVAIPGVSTRKGTRGGKSPASTRRPRSAAKSTGKRTVARLTRNVGASPKSTQVVNRTAMRSLFAETPVRTPRTVSPTPKRTVARLTRNVGASPKSTQVVNRTAMRSLFAETPKMTPTMTPSSLMSPTPMTVASPPRMPRMSSGASTSRANSLNARANMMRADVTSRSAARRSARIAKIAKGKSNAASMIPKF